MGAASSSRLFALWQRNQNGSSPLPRPGVLLSIAPSYSSKNPYLAAPLAPLIFLLHQYRFNLSRRAKQTITMAATASNFVNVTSPQHFKDLLSADLNRVSCLNFWAPWAEPCAAFTKAVEGEAAKFPSVLFLSVSPVWAAGEARSVPGHGCVVDVGRRCL